MMDGEEDERRETAIASAQSLQPNFKPRGVSQDQLSKFKEPHKKRLQIKLKSKFDKKPKEIAYGTSKSHGKGFDSNHPDDTNSNTTIEDSSLSNLNSHSKDISSSGRQDRAAANLAPKKRQKLYWGFDTKERWERKANL